MMCKNLVIYILYTGSNGFPLGDAYTNRVLALAKGLKYQCVKVKILVLYPGKSLGVDTPKGEVCGIDYEYCSLFRIPKNRIQKKLIGGYGILKAIRLLISNKTKTDAIISFSESFLQNFILGFFSRIKKIYFVREINEFPRSALKKERLNPDFLEKLITRISLKQINAFIFISNGIASFFDEEYKIKKPSLIVPIVVDKTRFSVDIVTKKNVITYCGNLIGEKDGVRTLIRSFTEISFEHPEIGLQLIGDTRNKLEISELKKTIDSLGISNKVVFTGLVSRDKIPKYLMESKLLVLARPDNLQAKGGFPTKLGEYLATSNPVIVTAVGDIPLYIKDGINGYLAKPGDVKDFANKMNYVLNNYSEALQVGQRGYNLVEKDFNADFQADRIVNFINKQITNT